jgi:hypothetical protein
VKIGDTVSWPKGGGGEMWGIVLSTKGDRVQVEHGSGNKLTRKWLPQNLVRVREPG